MTNIPAEIQNQKNNKKTKNQHQHSLGTIQNQIKQRHQFFWFWLFWFSDFPSRDVASSAFSCFFGCGSLLRSFYVSSLDTYKLPTLQPIDAVTLLRRKCAHALLFVGCANADTVFPA